MQLSARNKRILCRCSRFCAVFAVEDVSLDNMYFFIILFTKIASELSILKGFMIESLTHNFTRRQKSIYSFANSIIMSLLLLIKLLIASGFNGLLLIMARS